MTLEKNTSPDVEAFVMFIHYPDESVQQRHFRSSEVCVAWQKTMTLMKALGVIDKFHTFAMAYMPEGAVITE